MLLPGRPGALTPTLPEPPESERARQVGLVGRPLKALRGGKVRARSNGFRDK